MRGIGFGESTNERIVHECIWIWKMKEQTASIFESIGNCDRAVEEELAEDQGIGGEPSLVGKAMDLLHGSEGLALA